MPLLSYLALSARSSCHVRGRQALQKRALPRSLNLVEAGTCTPQREVERGDGKSFFTFLLCRLLADDFLAAPNTAIYPVRLGLRDLRQAGSPHALIGR